MIGDGRVPGSDPLRGDLPRVSTSAALAETLTASRVSSVEVMAERLRTIYVDLTADGDVLFGRPRNSVGYTRRVDGPSLRTWADAELPAWQHADLDDAAWAEVARLLAAWVAERDARARAAMPADIARAAELAAERDRDARRAELVAQQQRAADELAALDRADTDGPEPARPGGWLRRGPIAP